MIRQDIYQKYGVTVHNLDLTLPPTQAKQVREILKDPYNFDMITLLQEYNERDIENELIVHIQKILIELGKGFAFMGRQYHIQLSKKDYYIDLLFYHVPTHRYVVIELKKGEFKAEYVGKVNLYCSIIDDQLKGGTDDSTVGLILCQQRDRMTAEYALRDIHKPLVISEYELSMAIPANFNAGLPSIEEIEEQLNEDLKEIQQ